MLKSHEYQKFIDQRLQSNMSSVASDTASSKQQGEQPSKKTKPASKFGNLKPKRLQQIGPTDVKRFNSTSTMFVDNTISVPDNHLMMKAVANKILELILQGEKKLENNFKVSTIFDTPDRFGNNNLPGKSLIFETIKYIFETGQLSIDCTIIALVSSSRHCHFYHYPQTNTLPSHACYWIGIHRSHTQRRSF